MGFCTFSDQACRVSQVYWYPYEEALDNIRDAIRLHVEDRIEAGEEILPPESISLTSVSAWP